MSDQKPSILAHIDAQKSCILATVDASATPYASYATFVLDEETVYLFISDAARHTQHLLKSPKVSLLFIEDTDQAANIFARKRVTLSCRAEQVGPNAILFETIMTRYEQKYGGIVKHLRTMPDFRLFACHPLNGDAVFGFGEAYTIQEGFSDIEPKRGGHRAPDDNT